MSTALEKWLSEVKERIEKVNKNARILLRKTGSPLVDINSTDLKKAVRIIEVLKENQYMYKHLEKDTNKIAALSDEEVWK